MNKGFIRTALVVLLVFALLLPALPTVCAKTAAEETPLHFNSQGKFRILNISDIQDDETLDARVKQFIRRSVTDTQPDLIVLTGDNIYGTRLTSAAQTPVAIAQYMDIFESLGVPVALVFGNHDDEGSAWSKERQMAFYRTYSVCVANDENSSLSGCGTYNLPIYSYADRDRIAFNLWMFDTGSDAQGTSKWDNMRQDQLDWYVAMSNALKSSNGGVPVPSIAFQHIVVKEIYDALKQVSSGTEGAVKHIYSSLKYYVLPDTASPGSVLGESPCPSKFGDEFEVVRNQGDVRAIVCGHDHNNEFIVPHQGVDLICTTGCEYGVYSETAERQQRRGARVIDIDEATGTYTTFMVKHLSYDLSPEYYVRQEQKYVKDLALCCVTQNNGSLEDARRSAYARVYAAVDAEHDNGVVLRTDLNDGSTSDLSADNHHVIYAGYTLTDDPSEAMRGLGLFVNSSGGSAGQYDGAAFNGHTYVLCNSGSRFVDGTDGAVDLNFGTKVNTQQVSSNSMYFYATYDPSAGAPLTEVMIASLPSAINMSSYNGYSLVVPVFAGSSDYVGSSSYADLNKNAAGEYVYALTKSGGTAVLRAELDSAFLRGAYVAALKKLREPESLYAVDGRNALQAETAWVQQNIIQDLDADNISETVNQASMDAHAAELYRLLGALMPRANTVILIADGGQCSVSSLEVYDGEPFGTLPTPVRRRYIFLGWFTERDGGTLVTESTVYLAGSITALYAHWQPDTTPHDLQSVTVDDQIALHLILDLECRGKSPNDVSILLGGVPYSTLGVPADGESGCYRFPVVMAPSQIAEEIVVSFQDEQTPLVTSVAAYCTILCSPAYDAYAKEQALAQAILRYGQAASTVLGDDPGMQFADLDGMDRTSVLQAETVFSDTTGQCTDASFMALAKPEFRFCMRDISESDAAALNQSGAVTAAYIGTNAPDEAVTARFVKKNVNGYACVLLEVTGVSAENMDQTVEVSITGLGAITFNGNAFAKAMAQEPGTSDLGAALYNYGAAAKQCFRT